MTDPRSIYTPTAYEVALRDWVVLIAQEVDADCTVHYANQRGPKRHRPFITLQVLSEVGVFDPEHWVSDTPDGGDYEGKYVDRLSGTVSVAIYASNHRTIAQAIRASLVRADVKELLAADAVYVSRSEDMQDVTQALSTSFEPTTVIDFAFEWACKYTYTAQAVAEVQATITGQTLAGDITQTVTVQE